MAKVADADAADADVFEISLEDLKIREIEEIEEILGAGLDAAFKEGAPKGKAMRAVAFVQRKRTQPDFTLEQAGELVIRLQEPEPDPTPAPAS